MSLVYSAIFGILAGFLKKSRTLGLVLGLTVFSHWVLDFLTHRPDLPLWFDSLKVGLGMWNSLGLTVVMEAALFGGGIFLFLRTSPRKSTREKIIFWGLISFLLLIYAGNIFGPQPPLDTSSSLIAGPALAMWLIVAWGYWVDRRIDPHPMA